MTMSSLQGPPEGEPDGCFPGAFLSSSLSGGELLHPSELLLKWPESWYDLPPLSTTVGLSWGGGKDCGCADPDCHTPAESCGSLELNMEAEGDDEDSSQGSGELEKEGLSGGVVELEQTWVLRSLAAGYAPLESEPQVRLRSGGGAPQCQAGVAFRALVSTRASMHSKLQGRPISAVVSDWQMKWDWDLVLDKISELNERWTQQNKGGAHPGGSGPRVGVVAQWWKGVRKSEAGGKLRWRVLASGSWEVW